MPPSFSMMISAEFDMLRLLRYSQRIARNYFALFALGGLVRFMNIDFMIDNKWIADCLRQSGKSQADLARHLKRDPAAVTRLLNGKRQLKSAEEAEIRAFFQQPAVAKGMTEHIPGRIMPEAPLASLPEYGTINNRSLFIRCK